MKLFNPSAITSKYRANFILNSYRSILKKGQKVLDAGCGTGVVSVFLQENLKIDLTGCDIKNYLKHPIPFVKIAADGKLPFKTNSFDAVMLNDVLHHLEKETQIGLLKEAVRVGKKVLIFEVRPTLSGKLFDIVLNKLHYGDLKAPLTFRDVDEWGEVFKKMKVKYKIKRIGQPVFYPFSHIYIHLEKL